jgi:uncharacterized damage-inducible protein DinB
MAGNVAPVADEREGLLQFLAQQRHVVRVAAHGLTDEQARMVPSRSELSIGGLIKHLVSVESAWIDTVLQLERPSFEESMKTHAENFVMNENDTLDGILTGYDRAALRTEEVVAGIPDLGQAVPVPRGVPWFPDAIEAWSVRWVLLHLIEETARHAGHADIVREHIDGATAFPLMAAAEGWPATPWIQPWEPAEQHA